MKKYLLAVAVTFSLVCTIPSFAKADTTNLSISDIKVLINILVAIGVIPQDKIATVNVLLANYENTNPIQPVITQPSVTITSPNGGENWPVGSNAQFTIDWTYQGIDPATQASIYLQFPDGGMCNIGSSPIGAKIFWSIPESQGCANQAVKKIISGQYKAAIFVGDPTSNSDFIAKDFSDNYFTITMPTSNQNITLIPSDTFLNFNVVQGATNPQPYNLHLTNASSVPITYSISVPNQPAWLNTSYNTQPMTLGAGNVAGVGAFADATKVAGPGTYTTNLIFSGNFTNSPIVIPITLVVTSPVTQTFPSIIINPVISGTLLKGTPLAISWQTITPASQSLNLNNFPVDISITSLNGRTYTIASKVNNSYNWNIGDFPYPDRGYKIYSVPAGVYNLKVCQFGTSNCSPNSVINIVDVPVSQNLIDLGSIFPYQEIPGCPNTEYVRTYTVPAFNYPVTITTAANVHADDYLRINGNQSWQVSVSNACIAPRLVSSTEYQIPGYTLGSVIPAGTPIKIDLVDTVGIVSGASGKLLINQVGPVTPSQPTVTPTQVTIVSGQNAKLSLNSPYASHSSLYFACPTGVIMGTSPELCNTYIDVTSNADWSPIFFNFTSQNQIVTANYTVYTSSGSSMPVIASASITVLLSLNLQ